MFAIPGYPTGWGCVLILMGCPGISRYIPYIGAPPIYEDASPYADLHAMLHILGSHKIRDASPYTITGESQVCECGVP